MKRPSLKTYQKLCTEYYDLGKPQQTNTPELLFYMNHAQQANGPILEPMCGTGRFLIPMLQAGLDIEGFDASECMLNALKQKYALITSKPAPVWQQFVQDFSKNRLYALIFIPFGSWGLIIDRTESMQGLKKLYDHLRPSGKILLEIDTVSSVPQPCGIWRRGIKKRPDGSKIAINTYASFNQETQIFESVCQYEAIIDNKIVQTEKELFTQYLYKFDEMEQWLANIGFKNIKKYLPYDKTLTTNPQTPTLIYEATK